MMSAGVPGVFEICRVWVMLPRVSYVNPVATPEAAVMLVSRPAVSYTEETVSPTSLVTDLINPVGMNDTYARVLAGVPGLVIVVVRWAGVTEVLSVYA